MTDQKKKPTLLDWAIVVVELGVLCMIVGVIILTLNGCTASPLVCPTESAWTTAGKWLGVGGPLAGAFMGLIIVTDGVLSMMFPSLGPCHKCGRRKLRFLRIRGNGAGLGAPSTLDLLTCSSCGHEVSRRSTLVAGGNGRYEWGDWKSSS